MPDRSPEWTEHLVRVAFAAKARLYVDMAIASFDEGETRDGNNHLHEAIAMIANALGFETVWAMLERDRPRK